MTTLKELRQQSGKTAKEVADKLGVTRNAVTNYESGIREIGLEHVLTLAELYGCTEREYTPILAQRYKNTFINGCRSLYDIINLKFSEAVNVALRTLGYWNVLDAYRDNKAEEANKLVGEILDAMLKQ